jgi:hypothetical protein
MIKSLLKFLKNLSIATQSLITLPTLVPLIWPKKVSFGLQNFPYFELLLGIACIIFFILSYACVYYCLQNKKLKEKKSPLGFYWDQDQNPICPHCSHPLIQKHYLHEGNVFCNSCKNYFYLLTQDGARGLAIQEARTTLPL